MARTHTFKGSAGAGYGYAAFIEEGQLVITEDWDEAKSEAINVVREYIDGQAGYWYTIRERFERCFEED